MAALELEPEEVDCERGPRLSEVGGTYAVRRGGSRRLSTTRAACWVRAATMLWAGSAGGRSRPKPGLLGHGAGGGPDPEEALAAAGVRTGQCVDGKADPVKRWFSGLVAGRLRLRLRL